MKTAQRKSKAELARVKRLAMLVQNQETLDCILRSVEDPVLRAEVFSLMRPYLRFANPVLSPQ